MIFSFTIYQFAKQNMVAPIFSKFGRFFKTHRILRQYIWLGVVPFIVGNFYTNYFFLNQTEKLWGIHAERLNQK